MRDLPEFLKNVINKVEAVKCQSCKRKFGDKDLIGVGIHKSLANPKIEVMFLEMMCSSCNKESLFEIDEMSVLDFAFNVVYEMEKNEEGSIDKFLRPDNEKETPMPNNNNERKLPRQSRPRTKIRKKDLADTKRLLENMETMGELLLSMGMKPEDIKKYLKNEKNK